MLLPDAFNQEVLGSVGVAVDVACHPGIGQLLRPRKVHIETEQRIRLCSCLNLAGAYGCKIAVVHITKLGHFCRTASCSQMKFLIRTFEDRCQRHDSKNRLEIISQMNQRTAPTTIRMIPTARSPIKNAHIIYLFYGYSAKISHPY